MSRLRPVRQLFAILVVEKLLLTPSFVWLTSDPNVYQSLNKNLDSTLPNFDDQKSSATQGEDLANNSDTVDAELVTMIAVKDPEDQDGGGDSTDWLLWEAILAVVSLSLLGGLFYWRYRNANNDQNDSVEGEGDGKKKLWSSPISTLMSKMSRAKKKRLLPAPKASTASPPPSFREVLRAPTNTNLGTISQRSVNGQLDSMRRSVAASVVKANSIVAVIRQAPVGKQILVTPTNVTRMASRAGDSN